MKRSFVRWGFVGSLAAAGLVAACSDAGTPPGGTVAGAGQLQVALQLANGTSVSSATYTITGPGGFTKSGNLNVGNSGAISAVIGGLPAGTGFSITLSATSTDGSTSCAGSATFNVTAGGTTSVTVHLSCHEAATTGSVMVNGVINVCPNIDSVSSDPPNGNVITIESTADDPDNGPQPLTYQWTASSGTLSNATSANPTLTCTAPGTVSLTETVSDGDAGCNSTFNLQVSCPDDAALAETAWVEIGANNQALARLLTPYAACPSITVDGVTSPMTVRAPAVTVPVRPTSTDTTLAAAQTSGNSKASVFSTTTCEFSLPAGAAKATVAGLSLPLPKAVVNRVVIIGDTGCRISIGNVYQACGDPTQWPFSVIAKATAAMKPDLVLHVGDYEYRDNPCPPGNTACAGQPWGYGSDAWVADFFAPAAPLLAAAPWVMVRGNHEVCNRAGQGWYRYLDTKPFDTTGVKTCDNSANDNAGNFNDPWAVSFGDTQFIAFDSANAAKSAYSPAAQEPYTTELTEAAALSSSNLLNIFAVHHPVLGYSAANPPTIGNAALQSVMNAHFPGNYYPPNTALAIHGHVHDFQALSFSSNHPATFVAGNGGDNLDSALPATFDPNGDLPAPNTVVNAFAYSQEFGFMVMDRVGAVGDKNWKFTSYRTDGTVIAVCNMAPAGACSGVCDSTPGSQITCTDGGGNVVGTYDNIP
ncbi:MAG TPA: metallophosphoesterase [Polyangiaceae bacterium]|nr:metallophosphoesterase [Polyangiaceae bacterium]